MSKYDCAHVHWMPPVSFALFHSHRCWSTRIRSIHISCFLAPVSNTMGKCGLQYKIFLMFITNDTSSENIFIPENRSANQEARFHLSSLCVCRGSDSMQYLSPRWDLGTCEKNASIFYTFICLSTYFRSLSYHQYIPQQSLSSKCKL